VVAVGGQLNAGKSTLVNALLGQRLAPTGGTEVTLVSAWFKSHHMNRVWVHFRDGRPPVAVPSRVGGGVPQSIPYPQAEVSHLVVEAANRAISRGFTLMDTPGRDAVSDLDDYSMASIRQADALILAMPQPGEGDAAALREFGLVAGHTDITLAALSRADALLFVVNGSSELRASELAFLERATERVHTVLFVLTGIDKAYDGWRPALEENLRLLRLKAPRFAAAPWYPVSSRYQPEADRAAEQGRYERAGDLTERSGFTPLIAELRDNVLLRIEADRLKDVGPALEVADVAPGGDQRLLQGVPGVLLVAGDAQADRVHPPLVAVDQLVEGRAVAVRAADRQGLVRVRVTGERFSEHARPRDRSWRGSYERPWPYFVVFWRDSRG
jgi:hypothetical protein